MNNASARTSFVVIAAMSIIFFFSSQSHVRAEMAMGSSAQLQAGDNSKLDSQLAAFYEVYANFKPIEETIREITAANGGKAPSHVEIVKTREEKSQQRYPSSILPPNASPLIEAGVGNSDLIVMATPLSRRSLPIQDRTFLFTEYEVRVDQVISLNQPNLLPGETIIVSRGGGEMNINGVLVKAIEPAFDQFRLNQQYIFFLHAIRGTDAFQVLGSDTFIVENGLVSTASHLERATQKPEDLHSFLSRLRDAVARKSYARK